jgi:hypothetical protein
MKTAIGNDDLRHEWHVVEIDGKIRSRYGVYVEALKAGMELKQKFPLSLIKVQSFVSAVSQLWKATAYHPERHYMRGPGPKWREKH